MSANHARWTSWGTNFVAAGLSAAVLGLGFLGRALGVTVGPVWNSAGSLVQRWATSGYVVGGFVIAVGWLTWRAWVRRQHRWTSDEDEAGEAPSRPTGAGWGRTEPGGGVRGVRFETFDYRGRSGPEEELGRRSSEVVLRARRPAESRLAQAGQAGAIVLCLLLGVGLATGVIVIATAPSRTEGPTPKMVITGTFVLAGLAFGVLLAFCFRRKLGGPLQPLQMIGVSMTIFGAVGAAIVAGM